MVHGCNITKFNFFLNNNNNKKWGCWQVLLKLPISKGNTSTQERIWAHYVVFLGSPQGIDYLFITSTIKLVIRFTSCVSILSFRSCPQREPLSVMLLPSSALDFPKLHVCFSRMQSPQGAVESRRAAHSVSPSCHVLNNCCFTIYKWK